MDYFSIVIEPKWKLEPFLYSLFFPIVYWPILKCQLMTIVKTSRQSSFEILLDFCIFFPMLAATGAASSSAATQRVALAPRRSPRSSHGVRFSALLLRASTAVGASLVPSVQVGSPADQKPYEFCSIFFKIPKILS